MRKLKVFYESGLRDEGRDSYLKAIIKNIAHVEIIDMSQLKDTSDIKMDEDERVLALKPFLDKNLQCVKNLMRGRPQLDVEGVFTNKLTITAEAILRVMGDVEGKKIVIFNQSETVGIPLATELMKRKATVVSLNSKTEVLLTWINLNHFDWIITATGKDEMLFDGDSFEVMRMNGVKFIDLSENIKSDYVIRKIPTIQILKERLDR